MRKIADLILSSLLPTNASRQYLRAKAGLIKKIITTGYDISCVKLELNSLKYTLNNTAIKKLLHTES